MCSWLLPSGLTSAATRFLCLVHWWSLNFHGDFLVDELRSLTYLKVIGNEIRLRSDRGKYVKIECYTEEKVTDGAVRREVEIFFKVALE